MLTKKKNDISQILSTNGKWISNNLKNIHLNDHYEQDFTAI